MKPKNDSTTGHTVTTSGTQEAPDLSRVGKCHARLMLKRLFAQVVPGTKHCASLDTEEEIIACMAKKFPTLFIT